jgi:hypothetical protein
VVEWVKVKALSSSPRTAKNKKKKVFLIDFKVEGLLTKRAGGVALKW